MYGLDEVAEFTKEDAVKLSKLKRIRQDPKPLLNKLETEWFEILNAQYPNYERPKAQHVTFRLANGLRYTPDILAFRWPDPNGPARTTAWEVKGKWFTDDSNAKLKVFASAYPEIRVILVWKDNSQWQEQTVLP